MQKNSIFNTTICAVATAPGAGAIAIIRLSGTKSLDIAQKIWSSPNVVQLEPYKLYLGWIVQNQTKIDQAMIVYMPSPNSYTGENVVELHIHGSVAISQKVLELLTKNGAKLASPGEFTKRAFLNNKLDLTQAEAVGDLISANSDRMARLSSQQLAGELTKKTIQIKKDLLAQSAHIAASLDFSEEDINSQSYKQQLKAIQTTLQKVKSIKSNSKTSTLIRDGFKVALVGLTNAGKSTLLNNLLGFSRSIVTNTAGTTRDTLTETVLLDGVQINITDTAGLRTTTNKVEKIGISRTLKIVKSADLTLLLVAPGKLKQSLNYLKKLKLEKYLNSKNCIVVYTKSDLNKTKSTQKLSYKTITVSAKYNKNIGSLLKLLQEFSQIEQSENELLLTKRQAALFVDLENQLISINRLLNSHIPADILLVEYQRAVSICNQLTGEDVTEEVISEVFSNFCIGK